MTDELDQLYKALQAVLVSHTPLQVKVGLLPNFILREVIVSQPTEGTFCLELKGDPVNEPVPQSVAHPHRPFEVAWSIGGKLFDKLPDGRYVPLDESNLPKKKAPITKPPSSENASGSNFEWFHGHQMRGMRCLCHGLSAREIGSRHYHKKEQPDSMDAFYDSVAASGRGTPTAVVDPLGQIKAHCPVDLTKEQQEEWDKWLAGLQRYVSIPSAMAWRLDKEKVLSNCGIDASCDQGNEEMRKALERLIDESHCTVSFQPTRRQVDGDHYEKMSIDPISFALANKLDALQFSVVKHVTRHPLKGEGVTDLKKAIDYCQMALEKQYGIKSSVTYQ